jgi:iron complex outermembrane receptor protein
MPHRTPAIRLTTASIAALWSILIFTPTAFAERIAALPSVGELKRMSLDELMNIEVTSVSRTDERAADVASALHVITEEDIRRSGSRSIPQALRLAPNLQVAQSDARNWAISARGFNATFSNKLLVLIDGRSVYTPLYSGVFWDAQDTLLEDLKQIEVISGPGAAVWGANAVNGVVNVISKTARHTQGVLISGGAGTEEQAFAGARYGGKVSDDLHFRVYAKYFDRDDSKSADGQDETDAWHSSQAGFRLDWEPGHDHLLTVQGDIYDAIGDQPSPGDVEHSGGNLLARWVHRVTDTEEFQIQTYYDRTNRVVPGDFADDLDTFDLDAQYERDLGEHHHVMIGAGYRFSRNEVKSFAATAFLPAKLDRSLYSAFLQDELSLMNQRLKIALGAKVEHNDYTGWEVQPSARAAWNAGTHTFWGAVSRGVRTPARFDRHLFAPTTPPFVIMPGMKAVSESVVAYELGWRAQPHENVLVSVATFYNEYDDLRTISPGPPFLIENYGEGEIHGVEFETSWQATKTWRISGGYTVLQEDLRVQPGRSDISDGQGEAFDPEQQFQVRSSHDLPGNAEFDLWLRYVDDVGNTSARGFGVVPSYVTLDARLGWSPVQNLELAIVGQNLLDRQHPEFGNEEIERSVHGKLTWRY